MSQSYKFTDSFGSFIFPLADKIKTLYFPLGNENLMSSISPDLHGDAKSGQNSFLLEPVSRIDLVNSRASRNFWVNCVKNQGDGSLRRTVPEFFTWSATGASKNLEQIKADCVNLEAGLLWQKVTRRNEAIGLSSEILSFVPASGEPVEMMQIKITNISKSKIDIIPTAAIPIYGRGANSIRDHRHVTSLLQRIILDKFGVMVKPMLSFDETGHKPNKDCYFVLGADALGRAPQYIYPTQDMFCGESGDLEAPESALNNSEPGEENIQGKEAMGALRFGKVSLLPGKSHTYIMVMGIAQGKLRIKSLFNKFNTEKKVALAFKVTRNFWVEKAKTINLNTGSPDFDNWFKWVNIQPVLRKIFGCSFLPDFDYGKGGRGWRDLWQDCLGLILNNPEAVRPLLINNFSGVKIDGSNATIIGKLPGEFIADRNNISRVWMDHGVWPLITLDLYIHETGDLGILFEQAAYFKNHEINRGNAMDYNWNAACGNKLKVKSGKIYSGTIIEHLLVQNLVQFFNVGAHNHIKLEGADWNDGLDMAKEFGESVAFSSMYAQNLENLAGLLLRTGKKEVEVAQELGIFFSKIDYDNISQKHKILAKYFAQTSGVLSGNKVKVDALKLSRDLKEKSLWIKQHIRKTEWLKEGFFNGYYDNRKERVDGKKGSRVQMTLASQVFPVMSGVASGEETEEILKNVRRYLYDKNIGGIHLNTDFGKEQYDLGRAFSFAYGDKENGAVFSHMVVMFAYALYKQGYVQEGWQALNSLYEMAKSPKSKIYPCLPEYFGLDGQGMYTYLTGSASWFILTMLTQVFGVKGNNGDLRIEPKFSAVQFKNSDRLSIKRAFGGREIEVIFHNPKRLSFGEYRINKVFVNAQEYPVKNPLYVTLAKRIVFTLAKNALNKIEIFLG